jgi:hypothetical protein
MFFNRTSEADMTFTPNLKTAALAGILAMAFAGTAGAATDRAQTKSERDTIKAQYKQAKDACKSMKGNAKDVCMAEAKGNEKVAKAELEAREKNTPKNQRDLAVAKADAAYNVAKEKCDDLKGNEKDACQKDAKAAHKSAKDSAKAAGNTTTSRATTTAPAPAPAPAPAKSK